MTTRVFSLVFADVMVVVGASGTFSLVRLSLAGSGDVGLRVVLREPQDDINGELLR